MLKEIYEQPSSIQDTMRGRLDPVTKEIKLRRYIRVSAENCNCK